MRPSYRGNLGVMIKKRFYHYSRCVHLENILAEGLKPSPAGEGIWDSCFFWLTLPPDNIVWLTTTKTAPEFFSELLCGEVNEGILMRVTVNLSPNNRRLHHWPTWLQKHAPDVFIALDTGEIDEDGWHEHWFHEGPIAPSRIVAIDVDPEIGVQYGKI
jgi:hypothetical protein